MGFLEVWEPWQGLHFHTKTVRVHPVVLPTERNTVEPSFVRKCRVCRYVVQLIGRNVNLICTYIEISTTANTWGVSTTPVPN